MSWLQNHDVTLSTAPCLLKWRRMLYPTIRACDVPTTDDQNTATLNVPCFPSGPFWLDLPLTVCIVLIFKIFHPVNVFTFIFISQNHEYNHENSVVFSKSTSNFLKTCFSTFFVAYLFKKELVLRTQWN